MIDRRAFLAAGGAAAVVPWLPGWAQPVAAGLPTVSGADIRLLSNSKAQVIVAAPRADTTITAEQEAVLATMRQALLLDTLEK